MNRDKYPVKVIRNVLITMRDGVKLAANITRPDAEEKFPVIMEYSPYYKSSSPEPSYRHRYFAEKGYVLLSYDIRGTGDSEGISKDAFSPEEIQDGYDMVEWIAQQSWCNGNVGMWGLSYPGIVCMQVAMHNPPHLKAIIVAQAPDDLYTEWVCPGGSPRPYMFEQYAPLMTAYNFAPPNMELCGEKWSDIWNQHLKGNVPWGIGFVRHLLDSQYWRNRSLPPDYDRIKCPTFFISGWPDWYPNTLLSAFSQLKVPKRIIIGPWAHLWPEAAIPGPRIDGLRECAKWFDHWLKNIDTGVVNEPPVVLFVREYSKPKTISIEDEGFFRSENEWPLARGVKTPMYLHPNGLLSIEPYIGAESEHDEYDYEPSVGCAAGRYVIGQIPPGWGMPTDQRPDEAYSLSYTTSPLEEEMEVTGHPYAILYLSSTADIAYFSVKVCDVAPDGTSKLVTKGGLNATHRTSHTEPTYLKPGKVYELKIKLLAMSYVFQAGHSIRINIASADFQNAWPTSKPACNDVFRGRQHPSRIILPQALQQEPKLSEPDLKSSPHPLPPIESIPQPEYTVTHDIVDETTTVTYKTQVGQGINSSSFTVSSKNPEQAVVKSAYEYTVSLPETQIRVESQCITESDEKAFHHLVEIEVKVNGKLHFNKNWSVSVPREFV